MKVWNVIPKTAPEVIRHCRCGGDRFVCSGNFRVNANGKNLDVFLIYKCIHCDATWNMEILSRIKPDQIEKSLYRAFLRNDSKTALSFACDKGILGKNKAEVSYDNVEYAIRKEETEEAGYALLIRCDADIGIRLDKFLSDALDLSRSEVKKLFDHGFIRSDDGCLAPKTRVRGTIKIKELNVVK